MINEIRTSGRASLLAEQLKRLSSSEVEQLCGRLARLLGAALEQETDANTRSRLLSNLTIVAGRMGPADAARICVPLARSFAGALEKETDAETRRFLCLALVAVASKIDPAEAAKICSPLARFFATRLEQETQFATKRSLGAGFDHGREPDRDLDVAARICGTCRERSDRGIAEGKKPESPRNLDLLFVRCNHAPARWRMRPKPRD